MENLDYFYHDVEYSDLVSPAIRDEEGVITTPASYESRIEVELKTRPECKSLTDLERLIKLDKPETLIKKFAEMVAVSYQWEWLDLYTKYEEELTSWGESKEGFVPEENEEGVSTEFTVEAPVSPPRPSLLTGADVYLPYTREALKRARKKLVEAIIVEVDGLVFDGDELSQTRMTRAIMVMDDEETLPWTLKNNEITLVTRETLKVVLKEAGFKQSALWEIS